MSNVFEDIKKAKKKIFDATDQMPNAMDATVETFSEMGIDAVKDGEHLGNGIYRVRMDQTG